MSGEAIGFVSRTAKVLGILALLLALTAALWSAPPARAQGGTCVDDVSGRSNQCTAEDVRVSELRNSSDTSCLSGSAIDLTLRARLIATANERYDIGMFAALDGGNARTGTCAHDYLHPVSTSAEYDPLSGVGPYYNGELSDTGDVCGDIYQGVETFYNLAAINVPCVDYDKDGYLDISTCLSWDNNTRETCVDVNGAIPGTVAKCRCELINVANVTVTPGAIQVDKVAQPDTVPESGGPIVFTFTVTNISTSNVSVTIDRLVDTVYGDLTAYEGSTCTLNQTLAGGATYTCSITADVSGPPGVQTDYFTASGSDENGNSVFGTDPADVTLTDVLPSVAVVKSAKPASLKEPGGSVGYTVSVNNNSTALDPITLTSLIDDIYGDLTDPTNLKVSDSTCQLGDPIQPSASYTCTFKAQVTGVGGDKVKDTVTAVGVDDEENQVQGSDDVTVAVTPTIPETGAGAAIPVVAGGGAALGCALLAAGVLLRRRFR